MKYCVQICYTTHIYEEVEADSYEQAADKAKKKIDGYSEDEYKQDLVNNLAYDEAQVWPDGQEEKIKYL